VLDKDEILKFWKWFATSAGQLGFSRDEGALATFRDEAAQALAALSTDIHADIFPAVGGGLDVTLTARGVLRHFPLVRGIAAEAPNLAGLKVRALHLPRAIPDLVRFGEEALPTARMRVHSVAVLRRHGVMLLTSGVQISDYVLFRNVGRQIILDTIGEERFGHYITDVQMMDLSDWESGTSGVRPLELAEFEQMMPPVPANSGGAASADGTAAGRRSAA